MRQIRSALFARDRDLHHTRPLLRAQFDMTGRRCCSKFALRATKCDFTARATLAPAATTAVLQFGAFEERAEKHTPTSRGESGALIGRRQADFSAAAAASELDKRAKNLERTSEQHAERKQANTAMSGQSHHHHNYHYHHLHLHNSSTWPASSRSGRPLWCASPLVATGLAPAAISTLGRHFIASTLLIIWIAVALAAAAATTTTKPNHREENERQMHPSLFVDAKVWRGNTEFGERSNWRDGRKPCSLLERVVIEENEAVISIGDAMDSIASGGGAGGGGQLKSDIREFVLPADGLLLLEDDTLAAGPRDPGFLQMLNDTGDCFDSSALPDDLQRTTWFRFEPHPDTQSWFNPSNWYSLVNALNQNDNTGQLMVPESHQIPCAEDVVMFGNWHESLFSLQEAHSERSRLLAFKVNFRAAAAAAFVVNSTKPSSRPAAARANGLRVAHLKIGDKSYTQAEFDELAAIYGNNLFQFRDELSALSVSLGADESRAQSILTIDESSIQAMPEDIAVCLEESGCECGNEHPAIMDIICSFNEPLEMHEMPCRDPIQSTGYCNKICGTSVNINMDPTRFSERFVASLMGKIFTDGQDAATGGYQSPQYFSEHIFLGSRRVDHNKYEITMRLVPADNGAYTEALGRDLELAQLIKEHLEKAATKSFYGIKTISIKSSVDWRRDNRNSIFTLTFIVLLPLAMTLFAKFDDHLVQIVAPAWQTNHAHRHLSMVSEQTLIMSDDDESMSGRESTKAAAGAMDNLAMVDLDADSSMGSTLNLLDAIDE